MPALDLTPPDGPKVRRLNRLPIFVAIGLVVVFLAAVFWGLTTRGLYTRGTSGPESGRGGSASSFADQMKRGVADGIIGEPSEAPLPPPVPTKPQPEKPPANPFVVKPVADAPTAPPIEPDAVWRARLEREGREQLFREEQRQRMVRVQARGAAQDSPLGLDLKKLQTADAAREQGTRSGETCQSARNIDPGSASNFDPLLSC